MNKKVLKKETKLSFQELNLYLKEYFKNIEDYTKEDVKKIKLIKMLTYFDFKKSEIKELLNSSEEKIKLALESQVKDLNEFKKCILKSLNKDLRNQSLEQVLANYDFNSKKSIQKFFIPSISEVIIETLIFLAPIIWFLFNLLSKSDKIIASSILALISLIFLTYIWINYFKNRHKHKELVKENNRLNGFVLPVLLISILIILAFFVILNMGLIALAPKDFLFFDTNILTDKMMVLAIALLVIIILAVAFKSLNLNKIESLNIYYDAWKKYKFAIIFLFLLITYAFLTSVTYVTDSKIIHKTPLNPFGTTYDYADIKKIKTGFGTKEFSIFDYQRRGEFYYQIYVDDEIITFHMPSVNQKIEKYKDSYLELEEFDQNLVNLGIFKEVDSKNYKYCSLDEKYCLRFLDIIQNLERK